MRWLMVLIVLSGCGSHAEEPRQSGDNHGFGWEYDAITQRGLRLRYKPALNDGDFLATTSLYEGWFDDMARCTGLRAPMPFVIIQPLGSLDAEGVNGRYYPAPPLIQIQSVLAFQHEVIHYLLDLNGLDVDAAHTSSVWSCDPHRLT